MTFVLVLLVLALFLLVAARAVASSSETPPRMPVAALMLAAGSVTALVLALALRAPRWADSSQLAWLGVAAAAPGEPIRLGGSSLPATLAWPTGQRSPEISVMPAPSGGSATVSVLGEAAFVRLEGGGWINGSPLQFSQPEAVGSLSVEFEQGGWSGRKVRLRVLDSGGISVGSEELWASRRDRVVPVSRLAEQAVTRLRATDDPAHSRARDAALLESWAAERTVLVDAKAGMRIVSPTDAVSMATITLPATLVIRWPRQALHCNLETGAQGLSLSYLPPWRWSAPLPPPAAGATDDSPTLITVTDAARPGDHAFLLPIAGTDGVRTSALLERHVEGPPTLVGLAGNGQAPTATVIALPRWLGSSSRVRASAIEGVTSSIAVEVAPSMPMRAVIGTVQDLPQWHQLGGAAALALAVLFLGAGLTLPRLRRADAWTVAGLIAVAWTLTCVRLLLALRHAQDPSHLDKMAINGVGWALGWMIIVPTCMFLSARLWRDRFDPSLLDKGLKRRAVIWTLLLAASAVGALLLQAAIVQDLWQVREGLRFRLHEVTWVLLGAASFFLAGHLFFRHVVPTSFRPALRRVFLIPIDAFEALASRTSKRMWSSVADPRRTFVKHLVILVGLGVGLPLAILVGARASGLFDEGQKIAQEVLVPLVLCWIPAILWLAASVHQRTTGLRGVRLRTGALAVALAIVPVFVVPVALGDAGGILATLAVFGPLVFLLLLTRARAMGGVLLAAMAAVAFVAVLAHPLLDESPGFIGERVQRWNARLRSFTAPQQMQEWLPFIPIPEARRSMSSRDVRNTVQHTWENMAIVHHAGLRGRGLGDAPSRRSAVPQQVLQFDSTFSFFIVGDHGVIGGTALLLIYLLPLAIVLGSARARFDLGHGVALLIASALFLDAVFHAAMNLGCLPFTGRNLPLLSVNSTSDGLRWAVLLSLAVQAVLWRASGGAKGYRDTAFPITSTASADTVTIEKPEPSRTMQWISVWFVGVPLLLVGLLAWRMIHVVADDDWERPLDWSTMLGAVDKLADAGMITVDETTAQLALDPRMSPRGWTLIEQEIARFNGQSEDERREGHALPADVVTKLERCSTLADYDDVMRTIAAGGANDPPRGAPQMFELEPPIEWADAGRHIPLANPKSRVHANGTVNRVVSFHSAVQADQLPRVRMGQAAAPGHALVGNGFELVLPSDPAAGAPHRTVLLEADSEGTIWQKGVDPGGPGRLQVQLRYPLAGGGTSVTAWFDALVDAKGLRLGASPMALILRRNGSDQPLAAGAYEYLLPGDIVRIPQAIGAGILPAFMVGATDAGILAGPAWVMGEWRMTTGGHSGLPWSSQLAGAIATEARASGASQAETRFGHLTLDGALQGAAQEFLRDRGRALHGRRIHRGSLATVLPPRVALTILDFPSGEVRALGGWPRQGDVGDWRVEGDGEHVPSAIWLEEAAPRRFRTIYASDKNFDRMVLGSATKPLWAAATLDVHPQLAGRLAVSGGAADEASVFGIPVRPDWSVGASKSLADGAWCDFRSYLARSDNRYQIRLGLLGLAVPDGDGIAVEATPSGSKEESMDGGGTHWGRTPKFPPQIGFSAVQPAVMNSVHLAPLADSLHDLLGVSVRRDSQRRKISFWTAAEVDDDLVPGAPISGSVGAPDRSFLWISPPAADLALDTDILTPRQYISLLFGGGTNMWSNVQFAGAFASCVTGTPCIPHITLGSTAQPAPWRKSSPAIAATLRPGLAAVVSDAAGTAHGGLGSDGHQALQRLGVTSFAKTGTLLPSGATHETSRLVMLLAVRRKDGTVAKGLVLSLVIEAGGEGEAARWLGDFIVANEAQLRRLL